MNTIQSSLLVGLFLGAIAGPLGAATVSIGNARGYPGEAATVPVSLRGVTNIVAAQFDVAFNSSKVTSDGADLAARFTNHVVRSREIAPGVRRVLVYSLVNASLGTNGSPLNLPFTVAPQERIGSGPLTPGNVVLANADATALAPVSATAGHIFVTQVSPPDETGLVNIFFPAQPEKQYVLLASEDLIQWVNLATNVASGNFVDFIDHEAQLYPKRFYQLGWFDALLGGSFGPVRHLADGSVTFQLIGLAGRSYTLQTSSDLVHWDEVTTKVAVNGRIEFTDPAAANQPYRFYRVRSE